MSNFEVTGKIFKKLDQRSGTSARGEWVSQDFVLEFQDGNFPTNISPAWGKDRVAELNSFKEGDTVTVAFNIRGREYNGKWYNDLRAWRISAAQSSQPQVQQSVPSGQPAQAPQSQAPAPTMDDMQTSIPEDDLPF